MNLDLETLNAYILKGLQNSNLTYSTILNTTDKNLLLNIIDIINSYITKFNITFILENFILGEFLLLSHNNLKLFITPFNIEASYINS